MTDELKASINALIAKYEELDPEIKHALEPKLVRKINGVRLWLDSAIGWFHDDESDDDDSQDSNTTVEVDCPCGKKLKLTVQGSQ